MSKALGRRLPKSLQRLLNGNDLALAWTRAITLVTLDAHGFPHFAILSFGEVLSTNAGEIRIATYAGSSTTSNMQARPQVALLIVDGNRIYYVKALAREAAALASGAVRFDLEIKAVLLDDEAGARITSGITFDMAQGKDAWLAVAERTVASLR